MPIPGRSATGNCSSSISTRCCASAPAKPMKKRSDVKGDMMISARRIGTGLAALAVLAAAAAPAFAADAAPTVNKGDTAWMLTSSLLVLMMIVPGLALFYGGLARTKNMLSVMTQVGAVAALAMLVWVGWGYSMSFGNDFSGEFIKQFIS